MNLQPKKSAWIAKNKESITYFLANLKATEKLNLKQQNSFIRLSLIFFRNWLGPETPYERDK